MKIQVSPSADRHIRTIDDWWRENRSSAPDLFFKELVSALESLKSLPLTGRLCSIRSAREVRRILLSATRYHIYYRVTRDTVAVLAIWSAVRERGPNLRDLRGSTPRKHKRG